MMPADSGEVEDTETKSISSKLCDIEEKVDLRDANDFSSIPYQEPITEKNDLPDDIDVNVPCDKPTSSNDSNNQNNIPVTICFDSEVFSGQYVKKSVKEIEAFSVEDLKILIRSLSKAVEEISSQLVQLLVENDALQQESDARNIAIEQLLRITVKETENELKPVQMSVILASEDS